MKIIAIVQARMGSTRLPGKVMADICGKPMIDYVMERVLMSGLDVVIASPAEDYAYELQRHSVKRGWFHMCVEKPDNVAGRFAKVLEHYPCDGFVRICADSPLIDPDFIKVAADSSGEYALVESSLGCAEFLRTDHFIKRLPSMGPYNREHVTTHWRSQVGMSNVNGMPKLTVDTKEDLERVRGVVGRMTRPHTEYGWQECLLLA